ncbi:ATP-binding protein [[Ruminococcus] lactaris]|uniref:ATP-binding protein n=1 Tax=[Ruminococcus] lactaris TaxID=46228 RepID=UPI00242EFB9B|nr:ATP-binding protein [[Ruminococcus] lactaris]
MTGATGSGKTCMACALAWKHASTITPVWYVRLPDLLLDLQAARDNGDFLDCPGRKYISQ